MGRRNDFLGLLFLLSSLALLVSAVVPGDRSGKAFASLGEGRSRHPVIDVAEQLHLWSKRFGDVATQNARAVAADSAGNLFVVGDFHGTIDLGGSPLASAGSRDIFLAKFDPNGTHVWSKHFGDASTQTASDVAVDSSGNVVITGAMEGVVDFGGGNRTSGGSEDVFVAAFDPDGIHLWSQRFGDASVQRGWGVAVVDRDSIVVTGDFQGEVDFGGGALTSGGSEDVFVVLFDRSGTHEWSEGYGDEASQSGRDVAVDASGNVLLTGSFEGEVDFGGGVLMSAGSEDVFVAKFSSGGSHIWSDGFGDASIQVGIAIAADASDNVILTGNFLGTIDLGGGSRMSTGSFDIFLAKLDATGTHVWSFGYGDGSTQTSRDVAVDGSDEILLTGDFQGSLDLGGGALPSSGGTDVFLGKFDSSGGHLFSDSFGDGSTDNGRGVAVDAAGRITLVGDFQGSIDFGGGTLNSAGGADVFLAQFGPALEVTGRVRFWNPSSAPFAAITEEDVEICAAQANLPATPICAMSDASGNYVLRFFGPTGSGAPPLDVLRVTASRPTVTLRDFPAISGADAILLFQNAASLTMLSDDQLHAGDVTRNATTDLADATAVAQFLAFIPGGMNHTSEWVFNFVHLTGGPVETEDEAVFAIGTGMPIVNPESLDVRAFLLGDVDGSHPNPIKMQASSRVALSFGPVERQGDELVLRLLADVQDEALQSLIYSLTYDPNQLEYLGSSKGTSTKDFFNVDNPAQPGVVHGVSLGWQKPTTESGTVLIWRFRVKSADVGSPIRFSRLLVNDRSAAEAPEITLAAAGLPREFALRVAPNPFNPSTRILYDIPAGAGMLPVEVRIFDGNGRLVYTGRDAARGPGSHAHPWDGDDQQGRAVASGIYFVRVEAGAWSKTQKVSLLK